MVSEIKITQDTYLKYDIIQLTQTPQEIKADLNKVCKISQGDVLRGKIIDSKDSHVKIELESPVNGRYTWYVYQSHIDFTPKFEEDSIVLPVPYKSQLDNRNNPYGSCNVTSLAMCLEYLGAKRKRSSGQFEDELYEYALDNGLSRHSPQDLKVIANDYEIEDEFTIYGTFEKIRAHLKKEKPCIIHGYFTSFGHIIAVVGYDKTGLIVHDPYGEWFLEGYNTSVPGNALHYSYEMLASTCIIDNTFWVHYVG